MIWVAPDFVRAEQAPVPCELVFYFTTKLIAEPATTLAPGEGSWETTIEAGDGLVATSGPGADGAVVSCCALGFPFGTADAGGEIGCIMVTRPTENPASCRVFVTVPSGCPRKLGITKAAGESPWDTNTLTLGAETLVELAGGFCPTT